MEKRHLKYETTFEEVEKTNKFAENNWQQFKNVFEDGDVLYYFSSIRPLSGRAGYCIVRQDEIINYYITIIA